MSIGMPASWARRYGERLLAQLDPRRGTGRLTDEEREQLRRVTSPTPPEILDAIARPASLAPLDVMSGREVLEELRREGQACLGEPRVDPDDAEEAIRCEGWDLHAGRLVRAYQGRLGAAGVAAVLEAIGCEAASGVPLEQSARMRVRELELAKMPDFVRELERRLRQEVGER